MRTGRTYYIYILKLENGGRYVGSTVDINGRIRRHFNGGGSIATKESKPIRIDRIYRLKDYMIGSMNAGKLAEIMIANYCEERFGPNAVRGAQHGMGWNESPSLNQQKIINRAKRFALTPEGVDLLKALEVYDGSILAEYPSLLERE